MDGIRHELNQITRRLFDLESKLNSVENMPAAGIQEGSVISLQKALEQLDSVLGQLEDRKQLYPADTDVDDLFRDCHQHHQLYFDTPE